MQPNPVKPLSDVEFCKYLRLTQSLQALIDQWQGITILFRQRIQLSIIDAESQPSIWLPRHQNRRGKGGAARDDESLGEILDDVFLRRFQLFRRLLIEGTVPESVLLFQLDSVVTGPGRRYSIGGLLRKNVQPVVVASRQLCPNPFFLRVLFRHAFKVNYLVYLIQARDKRLAIFTFQMAVVGCTPNRSDIDLGKVLLRVFFLDWGSFSGA